MQSLPGTSVESDISSVDDSGIEGKKLSQGTISTEEGDMVSEHTQMYMYAIA